MKQYNKLFAILFAVLGVTTLQAQTDVTSTYLTNADFENEYSVFVNPKSDRAIYQPNGWTVVRTNGNENDLSILTSSDLQSSNFSAWTINNSSTRGNKTYWTRLRWGGQVWNWNGTTGKPTDLQLQQEMKQLPEGVYRLSADLLSYAHGTEANNHTYLIATNTTTKRSVSVEPTIYHEKNDNNWENKSILIPSSGTTKYTVTLQCLQNWQGSGEYISGFDNVKIEKVSVSQENPVDLTAFVGTAPADWVGAGGTYSNCVEHFVWGGTQTGEYLSQIVTDLPLGLYEVAMYCASSSTSSRDNGGATPVEEGSTKYVTLSANNISVDIPSYNRLGIDGDIPSYTLADVKVTDGTLKLLVNINQPNPNWIVANIKSLKYLGPDLSTYKDALSEALTKATNFDQTSIPEAMASQLESAISNGQNAEQTIEALQQATEQLSLILNVAENSQTLYTDLKNLITQCSGYASESYSSVEDESTRTAFNEAITTASTNGNKATTVEELTEVFNALEAARQDFILVAIPTTGNSYDMTFKIENPSFETGDLTGWTVTASSDTGVKPNSNGTYTTTGVDGNYLFNTYWKGNPLTQEISGLPSGVYELKVLVASDGGTVYLTADDKHNEGTMTSDKTIFLESSIEFVCTDGNAVIGVVGGADGDAAAHKDFVADGYWWYKADNFRLYRSFDPSTAQNEVKDLKSSATALLSKPMNKEAKATFESKINSVDETSDNPFELASMATMLNEAIAEAKVSITEYEKLKKYIDMTAVFTDVTSYTTEYNNGEYASTDVETTRQELNVLRFEAASAIYKNKVDVTGWTGSMGERSDQHWSGTAKSYKDANSWYDIQDDALTTTVHLIKGSYVLKVAGRSATENARLTLEVLGNTIEFHAKGDTGYGIDTDGKANFSSEGTYANDGKGRGWEWEFLKFTLDEDQDVTLSVNSYYNNTWQVWNSFGDISLWMDDETYVTVYAEAALKAPLAEADAMVNTKPMGTAENDALVAAINLSNTFEKTPAGLNAAVETLQSAVANAKAWRDTYYTEKGKLVAALERFEADYNDAENGALDYMCKSRWTTVIAKAQAAAVAKDDLTSHTGLTTATTELIAALDAATTSIGEYADLKSAIDNANTIINGGNIGDGPFQRPQSAVDNLGSTDDELAVYNDAEKDGEEVTSLTEALRNGSVIELNEPSEYDVFKVAISVDASWKFNNKPLTFADNGKDGVSMYEGRDANFYAQTLMLKKVEGNKYTMSTIAADGTELYASTGVTSGNGSNTAQIRLTDDEAKALSIEVIPTATEGLYNLKNTEADALLGCQDDNSKDKGGLFTVGIRSEFTITKVEMPSVTVKTPSYWGTMILPFAAEIPEGLTVYSCTEADGEVLTLTEVDKIEANTPYLICGDTKEFDHTFTGFGAAATTAYTSGLFTGTYVDYKTTAKSNTYVLQNNKGEVAFYLVGESKQPTVGAYRCYMTYENAAGAPKFIFNRGGDTTDITPSTLNPQLSIEIYDLMGRKVNTMEKGGMYIVNGKKVVIK